MALGFELWALKWIVIALLIVIGIHYFWEITYGIVGFMIICWLISKVAMFVATGAF